MSSRLLSAASTCCHLASGMRSTADRERLPPRAAPPGMGLLAEAAGAGRSAGSATPPQPPAAHAAASSTRRSNRRSLKQASAARCWGDSSASCCSHTDAIETWLLWLIPVVLTLRLLLSLRAPTAAPLAAAWRSWPGLALDWLGLSAAAWAEKLSAPGGPAGSKLLGAEAGRAGGAWMGGKEQQWTS